MWFMRVDVKRLSERPSPSASWKSEYRPTKYCAMVDPSSIAGTPAQIESVATGSFRLGIFKAGFGAFRRWYSRSPLIAPFLPIWVVASKVFSRTLSGAPPKDLDKVAQFSLLGFTFHWPPHEYLSFSISGSR